MQKIEIKYTVLEADGTPNELTFETNDPNVAIEWIGKIERMIEKKKVADEIRAENAVEEE